MKDRKPLRNLFAYFRRAWGPRAAYHLARVRLGRHYGLKQAYWYRDQLANDIVAYRIIKEPKHR